MIQPIAVEEYISDLMESLGALNLVTVQEAIDLITAAVVGEGRILLIGNGGSAATASHVVADLMNGVRGTTKYAFEAVCLASLVPSITALANDHSYEEIFTRQLPWRISRCDVLWVFSASGDSRNVVHASQEMKRRGGRVLLFSGKSGGATVRHADVAFLAPSTNVQIIEDVHLSVAHALCATLVKLSPKTQVESEV